MLKGIDISNWQAGLELSKISGIDFVICKVSEGLNFRDKYALGWLSAARERGLLTGVYHYARNNNPVAEADFFLKCCNSEIGRSILVLDYEEHQGGQWARKFVNQVKNKTGVWPIIYCSASVCGDFSGTDIPNTCGLWVAGYPVPERSSWPSNPALPYAITPWPFAAIWQFSSKLRLEGWSGNLDGNIAYMDTKAWNVYAKASSSSSNSISLVEVAARVILGQYGNGDERIKKLTADGYDSKAVQSLVNKIYEIGG